ncbi:MAG: DNA mismatch repair endonuclease MutL, partial [Oscillospiraceae bacterium]
MATIHVLSPYVAELIAAGEVVDRPASIAKELVENALDAGARHIIIEIRQGGIALLRVTDDGCGIERGQIERAFVRHATSKVETASDLERIGTLGFRGEALPSIAAVSRLTLITRTAEEQAGSRYVLKGGVGTMTDIGCPVGTSFEVRDVFYNTPARMKFLKKDVVEGNAVASLIDRLALANPSTDFEFLRDGQRRLKTPGDGSLLSAVRMVCGAAVAAQMMPVSLQREGVGVTGLISRPSVARPTRSLQVFFINSRYVRSRTCVNAVEEAYHNRLMGGRFPACVLNLSVDPTLVDVNVHPAKLEVRFSSEQTIYNAVYAACLAALSEGERQPEPTKTLTPFSLADFDYSARQTELSAARPAASGIVVEPSYTRWSLHDDTQAMDPVLRFGGELHSKPVRPLRFLTGCADIEADEPTRCSIRTEEPRPLVGCADIREKESEGQISAAPKLESVPFRVIGEAFRTYIIVEQGDALLLIDKHAAHERSIYNSLCHLREAGKGACQMLLEPVTITLPREEYAVLLEHPEALETIGIGAEDFGERTLLVREIPMILDGCD